MKTIERITDDTWDVQGIRFDRSHRGITWVNQQNEVEFLGIPKCGSITLRVQLHLEPGIVNFEDVPEDFFVFTIIRNPTKRVVSAYIEAVQDCDHHPGGRFKHDLELSPDKINWLDHLMQNYDDCTRFVMYLDKLEEWGFFEPHCVPQIIYLTDTNGLAFPNVQVFELTDLSLLEYHMDVKFLQYNAAENPGLKEKLYRFIQDTPKIKAQVERLYKYDFELWQNWQRLKQEDPEPVLD
jgi:hypothetical protein